MKEQELYIDFQPQQHVYYVEKADHSFGPVISGSQLSKNYLDDYYLKMRNLESSLRKDIIENKISPVAYYMTLQDLSLSDLASRVGICKMRVKSQLKPDGFKKLSLQKIKRYADVFNVPVANMFQCLMLKNEERDKIGIVQSSTLNSYFVLTSIETKAFN